LGSGVIWWFTALVAGMAGIVLWFVTRALERQRREAAVQTALATFGAAQAAALADPKQLLTWYPLAQAARKMQPEAFASLDAATGGNFPFTRAHVEQAHARVSTDWLAWEKAHDEEYRLKAAVVEQEIGRASGDAVAVARARLDRIQHEKIERYQQRYEEYIRTAKALQALLQ
jgi:hypothetical protein